MTFVVAWPLSKIKYENNWRGLAGDGEDAGVVWGCAGPCGLIAQLLWFDYWGLM